MRILAFNISHDASVCSINDGQVEFFCKEERLSRVKHDNMPFKSLELYKSLNFGPVDHALYLTPTNIRRDIEMVLGSYTKKLFNVELENFSGLLHHICHASLAQVNSGFEESLTFVIDRNGSVFFINDHGHGRESESVYMSTKDSKLEPIFKSYWLFGEKSKLLLLTALTGMYPNADIHVNNSLGIVKVYEAATTLIGQNVLENGKTMGLASYGQDLNYEPLFIGHTPIGEYFSHLDDADESVCFYGEESRITKQITQDNFQFYADKAKHVQLETQQTVLELIKKYVDATGINNVCLVGGYALNIVANNFYIKHLPNVNFYFEPTADDSGIAVGAAMLKYYEVTGEDPQPLRDNFYHYYNKDETIGAGQSASIIDVCDLLLDQKSVAIFEGNPESGPRALGHRSILFDPRNPNAKNIINKIKQREWYRPFAGTILEEEFANYFETLGIENSPHMTVNFDALQSARDLVPGIIHIDGSCRIQTVKEGFLSELIRLFFEKTGCPMLLNTSFNCAGEPLIQTKQDAINMLNNSTLDAVYFVDDQKLVKKYEK